MMKASLKACVGAMRDALNAYPIPFVVSTVALLLSAVLCAIENGISANAWIIWLACFVLWASLWISRETSASAEKWITSLRFCILAFVTAAWILGADGSWLLWGICCAWLTGVGSWGRTLGLWMVNWILLVWLPNLLLWNWFLSYPLRLLSTAGCAFLLQCFGFEVSAAGTELLWYGRSIAITTACSGVEQLEALLLIGLVLVRFQQSQNWRRVLQYLCILPAVLIANTLRLAVTLLGERLWGDAVFLPLPHQLLGFGMIGCAFALLYWCGCGIAPESEGEERS